MAKIDHAAIRTSSYEDAQKFFEDVFDMHMWREIGEKPERKCWFREGIQLCEVSAINTDAENGYDHISIAVDSVEKTMEKIKAYPSLTFQLASSFSSILVPSGRENQWSLIGFTG